MGILAKVRATISSQTHLLQQEFQHEAQLPSTFARMACGAGREHWGIITLSPPYS